MPSKPMRPCNHPGCNHLVQSGYCDKHKKDTRTYDRRRGTATERGYDHRWRVYREHYLIGHPLCVECLENEVIEPATVVDHRIPHKGDPFLFWDPNNHQSLCKRHHDIKTASEDGGFGRIIFFPPYLKPSLIPLTIVCGAPGSGKTTFVSSNKGPNDLVIDLDDIKSKLSGREWYRAGHEWLQPAINERNRLLYSLSRPSNYSRAWFIVGAAKRKDREFWKEGLKPEKIVIIETDAYQCLKNIDSDNRRNDLTGMFRAAVYKWWSDYQRGNNELVIKPFQTPMG